jgi:hypothetical protein
MDLRYGPKHKKKIERLIAKHGLPPETEAVFDQAAAVPVIAVQHQGAYVDWTRGIENVSSFIRNGGVVHLRQYCPLVKGRCKGPKCQFYVVTGATGDCALKWTGIAAGRQLVAKK